MRPLLRASTVLLFLVTAVSASAQPAGPGGGGRGGPGPMTAGAGRPGGANPVGATADFLLAHTGDLALTDAQVVRLAAISRRTEARRKTLAARMDSLRTADRPVPGDSGRRGPGGRPGGPLPADVQQLREQVRTDVRDAIAVLTPDQQATAWMMIAGGGPLGGGPGMGFGTGPGQLDAGAPRDRGPISRPPAARDVPRRPDGASSTTP